MAGNAVELLSLLRARPVFDRALATQIVLLKNQTDFTHVLEVYNVALQKKELDSSAVNLCLGYFAKHGNAPEAQRMVQRAQRDGVRTTNAWYTSLASAHAVDKDFTGALDTLKGMHGRISVPTFPTLIKTLGASKNGLKWCLNEFFRIVKSQVEVSHKVYSALISQFAKAGDIDVCIKLFREMKKHNVEINDVVYNTVIEAYAKDGDMVMCEDLLDEMKRKGFKASIFTYNSLLKGWAKQANIEKCEAVLKEMESENITKTQFTYCAMMDAHKRKGDLARCIEVFQDMISHGVQPNTLAYNTLIGAYGEEGQVDQCEKLYQEMQVKGFSPNALTYHAMLTVFEKEDKEKGVKIPNVQNQMRFVEKGMFVTFLLSMIQW